MQYYNPIPTHIFFPVRIALYGDAYYNRIVIDFFTFSALEELLPKSY